jgi:outer membrane protein OmpA-like peptidoglycan-associated protein
VLAGAEVFLKDMTGKDYKTIAGPDGRFSFELSSEINQHTFHVTYEKYKDKTTGVSVTGVDESDWQKDILNNEAICLEKNIKEEKKLVIKAENVVTLYYDFDKSLIRDREKRILDSVFTVLDNNKSYTIQISGYTDGFGTNEYNDKLSNRRAKAAADYLVKKGIETSRISFVSFGECCPAEMEIINGRDNPDGRSKNRRALINISKEE